MVCLMGFFKGRLLQTPRWGQGGGDLIVYSGRNAPLGEQPLCHPRNKTCTGCFRCLSPSHDTHCCSLGLSPEPSPLLCLYLPACQLACLPTRLPICLSGCLFIEWFSVVVVDSRISSAKVSYTFEAATGRGIRSKGGPSCSPGFVCKAEAVIGGLKCRPSNSSTATKIKIFFLNIPESIGCMAEQYMYTK